MKEASAASIEQVKTLQIITTKLPSASGLEQFPPLGKEREIGDMVLQYKDEMQQSNL